MAMLKFAVILVALALVRAENEFGQQRGGTCMKRYLAAILGDSSKEEACKEMQAVATCLRDVADECLTEDKDAEVDNSLTGLDKLLQQESSAQEEKEEDDDVVDKDTKCVGENQNYLLQCLAVGISEVDTLLAFLEEIDMNLYKCSLYLVMSDCIVERIAEKCGEMAGRPTQALLADRPPSVEGACSDPQTIEFYTTLLFDRKKK